MIITIINPNGHVQKFETADSMERAMRDWDSITDADEVSWTEVRRNRVEHYASQLFDTKCNDPRWMFT